MSGPESSATLAPRGTRNEGLNVRAIRLAFNAPFLTRIARVASAISPQTIVLSKSRTTGSRFPDPRRISPVSALRISFRQPGACNRTVAGVRDFEDWRLVLRRTTPALVARGGIGRGVGISQNNQALAPLGRAFQMETMSRAERSDSPASTQNTSDQFPFARSLSQPMPAPEKMDPVAPRHMVKPVAIEAARGWLTSTVAAPLINISGPYMRNPARPRTAVARTQCPWGM